MMNSPNCHIHLSEKKLIFNRKELNLSLVFFYQTVHLLVAYRRDSTSLQQPQCTSLIFMLKIKLLSTFCNSNPAAFLLAFQTAFYCRFMIFFC